MLISTADLARSLAQPDVIVFDCRHDLADHAQGRRQYEAGHLPAAFFAPVETALSGPKTGSNGRHPLPDPQAFAHFLARHGVTRTTRVVAYDDAGGLYAARLWWLARWVGVTRAALLDGGLTRWVAEGRPLTAAQPTAQPAERWTVDNIDMPVVLAEDVLQRLDDPTALVVDARAPERFRGEQEPIDPVAGHIPGAVNRPYRLNLRADSTFRPPAELRREFRTMVGGRAPGDVVHQCGSGITACANLFAMEYAGLPGSALYAGSWSEWVADPSRPVARN